MEPSTYLADLYQEDIYLIPDESEKEIITETPIEEPDLIKGIFLGKNKKGVIILVEYPGIEGMPPDHEELLRKILTSVQLTIEDVYVVNTANYGEELLSFGEKIIAFGPRTISGYEGPGTPYEIITTENNTILLVDNFSLLSEHKALKLKLWEKLKEMFL